VRFPARQIELPKHAAKHTAGVLGVQRIRRTEHNALEQWAALLTVEVSRREQYKARMSALLSGGEDSHRRLRFTEGAGLCRGVLFSPNFERF
jgi:hypothetical protein